VSGAQARGAASVPSAQQPYRPPSGPPVQHQPMQHQPMTGGKPENSGGRQVLIVLAVVLALLVLLCAGVISFLYKQGNNALAPIGVVRMGVDGVGSPAASYGLMKQVDSIRDLTQASKGRQTL
jgi:serine/threonine-protein kinase